MAAPTLEVEGLTVAAATTTLGTVYPVTDVSFSILPGETVGLIGESGSGKSTIVRSLVGLLARNARVVQGTIRVAGNEVLGPGVDRLQEVRGGHVGVIAQHSMASLNPLMRAGSQIDETVRRHRPRLTREERRHLVDASLRRLGFADPRAVRRAYPHQLSGGMRQRIAISLATVLEPELVIADECTTALDVTTQAEVVSLLREMVGQDGSCLLFVTHDLMLASEVADRILVMYAGEIVEAGTAREVLDSPRHPYTRALMEAVPSWGPPRALTGIPGVPPVVGSELEGCRFAARCPVVEASCTQGSVPWFGAPGAGHRCRRAPTATVAPSNDAT